MSQAPLRPAVCSHCLRALPRRQLRHPRHSATLLRAVAAEDKTGIDAEKIGKLVYKPDEESWQDVMAFTGPGPEVPRLLAALQTGHCGPYVADEECASCSASTAG